MSTPDLKGRTRHCNPGFIRVSGLAREALHTTMRAAKQAGLLVSRLQRGQVLRAGAERSLAQRTATAAKEVKELRTDASKMVRTGCELTDAVQVFRLKAQRPCGLIPG